MRRELIYLVTTMAFAGWSQCGATKPPLNARTSAKTMVRSMRDPFGWPIFDSTTKQVGIVSTRLEKQGVVVTLDTMGLPPGVHGVHIHEIPKCEPPSFASAGGHWNWTNRKHGHKNPRGYHAGDLGNLKVGQNRKGQATFLVAIRDWDRNLTGGLPLVIHSSPDDGKTDPSGNSGARIACGILYLRKD